MSDESNAGAGAAIPPAAAQPASSDLATRGTALVDGTIADIKEALPSITDTSLLRAALQAEKDGQCRATVIALLEKALKPVAPVVETVKMVREKPQYAGGPVEADVHPDEVGNYAAGGWSRA